MILPIDSKPPLDEDDGEQYDDRLSSDDTFSDSQPSDYIPYAYTPSLTTSSSPSSPLSRYEYAPLSPPSTTTDPLLAAGPEDLEWGPVPPYTPSPAAPTASTPPNGPDAECSKRACARARRRRWIKILAGAAVAYLAVLGAVSLVVGGRIRGRGRGRFEPEGMRRGPRPDPLDRLHEGAQRLKEGGGDHGHAPSTPTSPWPEDGEARNCVNYPTTGWVDLPTLTEGKMRRGLNRTFFLPAGPPTDLFTHLTGIAAIGNISVHNFDATLQPYSLEAEMAVMADVDVAGGEFAKVVVEAVIDSTVDEELKRSEGWQILSRSPVCFMDRKPRASSHGGGPRFRRHAPPGAAPQLPFDNLGADSGRHAMGVGIYSPDHHLPHRDNSTLPSLSFNIYILLPSYASSVAPPQAPRSLWARMLGLPTPPAPPRGHVPALDIRSNVANVHVDAPGASLGRLSVRTALGGVAFEALDSEVVEVGTNGKVSGRVGVSDALVVHTTVGDIDVDVSVNNRPAWAEPSSFFPPRPHHPHRPHHALPAPPVRVALSTESGRLSTRFSSWLNPAVSLDADLSAIVGDVDVVTNPAFQGMYHLATTLGGITVDVREGTEDPEGQGRRREVTKRESGGVGGKVVQGEVRWVDDSAGEGDRREKWDAGRLRVKTTTGNVNVEF